MFKETGKKRCAMMLGVIFLNIRISERTIFVLRENYRVFMFLKRLCNCIDTLLW